MIFKLNLKEFFLTKMKKVDHFIYSLEYILRDELQWLLELKFMFKQYLGMSSCENKEEENV